VTPATLSAAHREQILQILAAAIRAVDPAAAVRAHVSIEGKLLRVGPKAYNLADIGRIVVVGAGKAGTPMAVALVEILGERITAGSVNVKYGHTAAAGNWRVRFEERPTGNCTVFIRDVGRGLPIEAPRSPDPGPIAIIEAGHPVPDAAGQAGAEKIVGLLQGLTVRQGLLTEAPSTGQDLIIVLISGGGSALLPLPVAGITLADYQALTTVLLRCGADITEINAVRKHCSRLQGGQLARLAQPAQVATLILSDVVGTRLDAIASGPTVPDPTTFTDAVAVLNRYGVLDQIPASVRSHLLAGAAGEVPETPKAGDPLFERVTNVVIGDNASAGRAAVAEAKRLGFQSALLTTFIQGEAREIGRAVAGLAQGIALGQSDYTPPVCLVLGGETTVTVRGQGSGGRNQELALAAGLALNGYPLPPGIEVAVVSLGTDGTDGPTDAAGGLVTADTLARGRALGLDAAAALANNDSYHYLGALGDLIITGPTNTNVNDLIFVFVA
jgi:hydroxypyruvate reductase